MAGNIHIIQPAHATQVSVERIFQTRPHQPEIEQRHIQEEIKKANEEKHEQTQQLNKGDKAIIREREKEKQQKKRKKQLAKQIKNYKEETKSDPESKRDEGKPHLDIKI